MGNSTSKRDIDLKRYCKPQGLYPEIHWDEKQIASKIMKRRLAPCFPGSDEKTPHLEECPICFLNYPVLNRSTCCKKPICTECYLQVKRPKPSTSDPVVPCPFCKASFYEVQFKGPQTEEEKAKEHEEEQRVIALRIQADKDEQEAEKKRAEKRQQAKAQGKPNYDYYSEFMGSSPPPQQSYHPRAGGPRTLQTPVHPIQQPQRRLSPAEAAALAALSRQNTHRAHSQGPQTARGFAPPTGPPRRSHGPPASSPSSPLSHFPQPPSSYSPSQTQPPVFNPQPRRHSSRPRQSPPEVGQVRQPPAPRQQHPTTGPAQPPARGNLRDFVPRHLLESFGPDVDMEEILINEAIRQSLLEQGYPPASAPISAPAPMQPPQHFLTPPPPAMQRAGREKRRSNLPEDLRNVSSSSSDTDNDFNPRAPVVLVKTSQLRHQQPQPQSQPQQQHAPATLRRSPDRGLPLFFDETDAAAAHARLMVPPPLGVVGPPPGKKRTSSRSASRSPDSPSTTGTPVVVRHQSARRSPQPVRASPTSAPTTPTTPPQVEQPTLDDEGFDSSELELALAISLSLSAEPPKQSPGETMVELPPLLDAVPSAKPSEPVPPRTPTPTILEDLFSPPQISLALADSSAATNNVTTTVEQPVSTVSPKPEPVLDLFAFDFTASTTTSVPVAETNPATDESA